MMSGGGQTGPRARLSQLRSAAAGRPRTQGASMHSRGLRCAGCLCVAQAHTGAGRRVALFQKTATPLPHTEEGAESEERRTLRTAGAAVYRWWRTLPTWGGGGVLAFPALSRCQCLHQSRSRSARGSVPSAAAGMQGEGPTRTRISMPVSRCRVLSPLPLPKGVCSPLNSAQWPRDLARRKCCLVSTA